MIPPFNKLGNFFPIYFVAFIFIIVSAPFPPKALPAASEALPAAIEAVSASLEALSADSETPTAASEALLDDCSPPNYLSLFQKPLRILSSPLRSYLSLIHSSHCNLQRFAALHRWRP